MLTREQVYNLLILRNREGNVFSGLPIHIIQNISDWGQDSSNAISKALTHAASGQQKDVNELLYMLAREPGLLLQAGNVKTPGGLEVQRVTIYEFLLGAGDIDFADMVVPFFLKIPGAEAERQRQLERYRPHLQGMLTQEPYAIQPIFDLLLNPANQATIRNDVRALLANNTEHKSALSDAIMQFRNAHLPTQPLINSGMHFNYATQNALYQILFDNRMQAALQTASGNNSNMINLIWLKMICHLMNFYPGIDRCITAQGIGNVYNKAGEQVENIKRSYKLRYGDILFPTFGTTTARGVLGVNFGVSLYGHYRDQVEIRFLKPHAEDRRPSFLSFMLSKSIKVTEHLCNHTHGQQNQPSV